VGVLCKISKKNKAPKSIAKCKFYGLKYLCDSKTRDISNLFFHLPKYMKPPSTLNDPKQTTIDLRPGDVSGLICTSTRFNFEACRRAIIMFVIVDEQPFRVVEGEGFMFLCRQLQP